MSLAVVRDQPHLTEHYASMARRMEHGKMPKTLAGLVRWLMVRFDEETPERLHKGAHRKGGQVWHDFASGEWREQGIGGGSMLGTLPWAEGFRRLMENTASQTDEDGYFLFPIRHGLWQLERKGRPFMARFLWQLAMCGGDHRLLAERLGYELEMMEVYAMACLVALWKETHDRTRRVA